MSIAQLAGQLARDERSVFLFRDYIHNANKYEEQDPFRNYLPYICQLQPLWVLLLEDSKRPAELAAAISEAFSLEFLSLLVDGGGESKSENAIALPIAALPWRMQKELLKYLDVPASLRQTSYDYDVFESPTLNFLAEHSGGALQFTSTSCLLIPDPLFYYLITFVNMIVLREDHLARMLDALEDTRRSFLSSAAFLQSSASIGGRTGGGAGGRPGGAGAAAPAKQAVHNLGSNFLTPFFAPTGRSFAQVQKGPGRARFGASEFVFTNRRESKIYEKLLIDYLYIFRSGGAGGGRENYMGAAMDQARTAQERAGMVLRGRRGAGQRLLHCLMFDFWFASLAETFPAEERGGQGTASAAARIADPTIDLILHCNSILPVMRVALLHLLVENQPCVTDFIFLTERILRKMLTPGLLPPDLLHSDCLLQLLRTWLVVCQPWLATSLYPYYVFTFNQFGGLKGRKMLDVSQPEALIGLEPEALTHFRSSNDRFVSTAAGASGGRGGSITQTNQVDRILPDLDTWTGLGRSKLLDDLTYFSKNEIGFLMQQYHEAGSSTSSRAQGQAVRAGTNTSATNKQSSSSGGGGFFSWLLSGPSADARAAIGDSRASAATRLLNRALYGPSLDYLAFGFHTTAPAVSTTATFTAERYQAYVQQHWSLYALLKPFLRHPAFKELQKCCREKYHKVQAIIGQLPGGAANSSARSGAAPGVGTSSSSRGAASIFTTWRGHKLSGKDQLNIYNDFLALIFQTLQCFSEQALLQQLFFCQQSGVVPATKMRLRGEAVRMRTSLTQARALLNQPAPAGRSGATSAVPAEELFFFGRNRRSSEQVDQVTGALKNAQSSTEAAFGRPIADFYSSPAAGPGTDGVVLVESLSNNVVEEAESAVSNLFDEAENFVHEVATNAQTLVETVDYVFGYDSASTFGSSGDLPIMNASAIAGAAGGPYTPARGPRTASHGGAAAGSVGAPGSTLRATSAHPARKREHDPVGSPKNNFRQCSSFASSSRNNPLSTPERYSTRAAGRVSGGGYRFGMASTPPAGSGVHEAAHEPFVLDEQFSRGAGSGLGARAEVLDASLLQSSKLFPPLDYRSVTSPERARLLASPTSAGKWSGTRGYQVRARGGSGLKNNSSLLLGAGGGIGNSIPTSAAAAEAQLATPQLSRIAELPYSGGGASDPYTQSTRAGPGLLQQESSSVRVTPVVYGKDYARIMGEPHVLGAQGGWSDGSKESLVGWIFGKVFCCSACARRSSAGNSAHVAVQQTRGRARGAGAPSSATSSGAGIIPESRASTAPGAAAKHSKAPNSRQPHKTPNLHMLPARLYDAFPRLKHRLRHETIAWRRVFEGGARGGGGSTGGAAADAAGQSLSRLPLSAAKGSSAPAASSSFFLINDAASLMSSCPDSPTQRAGRKYPRLDETCPVTEQFLFSEKKRMAARTGLQRSFASGSDPSGLLLDFSGAGAGGVHHPYLNSLAVSPDKIQDANSSLMTVARSSYHDTTTQMTQQPRRRTHNRGFEHVHFHGSSWTKPVRSYESAVLVYLLRQLSFVLDFLWRLGFGAVVSTAGAGGGGPGGELHPNIQWPRHLADLRLLSGFALVMAAALLFAAE